MDLVDDEPRPHPKPMPFCQNSLLQPVVPEVSILLQDNSDTQSVKKNDSFTGTEFQTYNSWRWKHINSVNSNVPSSEPKVLSRHSKTQDCFLIKDKYFTSDIEKRKNEILYGEIDEPRRPLPPRANPVIPSCVESFFSNSFDDITAVQEPPRKAENPVYLNKDTASNYTNQMCLKKELDNSEKLYNIISEQNKQMQVLQNQIEQLLRLQETKDKQTEQLLKCQESKEKKIEQLLQSLDSKEKEIRQLTISKEKQEQHLQELLKSKENLQKENFNLVRKLNEIKEKEMCSVSVMACVDLVDANTCTDLDGDIRESNNKMDDNTLQENISCLRDGSRLDDRDKSLSLHSSDLPVIQENAPTPQSSIHVDIQDFPDSSDDSESEAGIPSNRFSAMNEIPSSPLGYTFYNNVLTQLKDIIQNSGEKENHKNNRKKSEHQEQRSSKLPVEHNCMVENRGPVQSFQTWDILEKENKSPVNNMEQKNGRFSDELQNICLKDTSSPSDISLKINALAMKYLKQEQIPDLGMQTQFPTPFQHDVTIYNVTNLSFGSMRYLDRYQMLPNIKENQKQMVNVQKNGEHSPAEILRRKKRLTVEENITSVGNILDITTLNQQPKFL